MLNNQRVVIKKYNGFLLSDNQLKQTTSWSVTTPLPCGSDVRPRPSGYKQPLRGINWCLTAGKMIFPRETWYGVFISVDLNSNNMFTTTIIMFSPICEDGLIVPYGSKSLLRRYLTPKSYPKHAVKARLDPHKSPTTKLQYMYRNIPRTTAYTSAEAVFATDGGKNMT